MSLCPSHNEGIWHSTQKTWWLTVQYILNVYVIQIYLHLSQNEYVCSPERHSSLCRNWFYHQQRKVVRARTKKKVILSKHKQQIQFILVDTFWKLTWPTHPVLLVCSNFYREQRHLLQLIIISSHDPEVNTLVVIQRSRVTATCFSCQLLPSKS